MNTKQPIKNNHYKEPLMSKGRGLLCAFGVVVIVSFIMMFSLFPLYQSYFWSNIWVNPLIFTVFVAGCLYSSVFVRQIVVWYGTRYEDITQKVDRALSDAAYDMDAKETEKQANDDDHLELLRHFKQTVREQGYLKKLQEIAKKHQHNARAKEENNENLFHAKRHIIRFMIGALVFVGLIGTFMGLLQTVGAVIHVIANLQVEGSTMVQFSDLQSKLYAPLSGMSMAFSSSLFGLSGSLLLGVLDLLGYRLWQYHHNRLVNQERLLHEINEEKSKMRAASSIGSQASVMGHDHGDINAGAAIASSLSSPYIEACLEQNIENSEKIAHYLAQLVQAHHQSSSEVNPVEGGGKEAISALLHQAMLAQQQSLSEIKHLLCQSLERQQDMASFQESQQQNQTKLIEKILNESGQHHASQMQMVGDQIASNIKLLGKVIAKKDINHDIKKAS